MKARPRPFAVQGALSIVTALVLLPAIAQAGVLAQVSLSRQLMLVSVDGTPLYEWPVSTARAGYHTPTGRFRPTSLQPYHRSAKYYGSPMPYSIFFYKGFAIHGSYETRYIGRPASHGCVRLYPQNAAELFALVQRYGPGNTVIEIVR